MKSIIWFILVFSVAYVLGATYGLGPVVDGVDTIKDGVGGVIEDVREESSGVGEDSK